MENKLRKYPHENLLLGRRALEEVIGLEILEDLQWNVSEKKWVIHCSLFSPNINEERIPQETEWYILIDENYPRDSVKIYPSKTNGIYDTYPHQSYNSKGDYKLPWRTGNLCLDANIRVLGREIHEVEPKTADRKLLWYCYRAIEWLINASKGSLLSQNDLFELPDFPKKSKSLVSFNESYTSYNFWKDTSFNHGVVNLYKINNNYLTKRFQSLTGQEILTINWGRNISLTKEQVIGGWILIKELPIIPPWKSPDNWGELEDICIKQGIPLYPILKNITNKLRESNSNILLVGFPIPYKIGRTPQEIFWQGIELPNLTSAKRLPKGFRKNNDACWKFDRIKIFSKSFEINWMPSKNWGKDSIMARGKLSQDISETTILQIGCGALGSSIAEQMVRSGLTKLTLIDFDSLEMGNLVRHTLQYNEIGQSKAKALAKKLNLSSIHADVHGVNDTFKNLVKTDYANFSDIILDCTGEDDVIESLADLNTSTKKYIFSISLGLGGKRLYVYHQFNNSFSADIFRSMMNPWLKQEIKDQNNMEFPREGIGCWHPLFPARIDDVWMMSSIAIKRIEEVIKTRIKKPTLSVYEQTESNFGFNGVRLINLEENSE